MFLFPHTPVASELEGHRNGASHAAGATTQSQARLPQSRPQSRTLGFSFTRRPQCRKIMLTSIIHMLILMSSYPHDQDCHHDQQHLHHLIIFFLFLLTAASIVSNTGTVNLNTISIFIPAIISSFILLSIITLSLTLLIISAVIIVIAIIIALNITITSRIIITITTTTSSSSFFRLFIAMTRKPVSDHEDVIHCMSHVRKETHKPRVWAPNLYFVSARSFNPTPPGPPATNPSTVKSHGCNV